MPNAYPIYMGQSALIDLQKDIKQKQYRQVVVIADEHTFQDCYPIAKEYLPEFHHIIPIFAGEIHKTIQTCTTLWAALTDLHIDRNALIINLGGGVIGDMGGFVASTYKRGIDFVQVPTSLLAQVDASVGSKLGVDFNGYKNQIGLFAAPKAVYIYPEFLKTLPEREWYSGFAEVVKHHLIADKEAWMQIYTTSPLALDINEIIRHSIDIKQHIVRQDPTEKGLRKILNFGHTIGHAIESFFIGFDKATVLHGEAVAIGMLCESHLSWQKELLSESELFGITDYLIKHFYLPQIPDFFFLDIYKLMRQDKKNIGEEIQCVLLNSVGQTSYNQVFTIKEYHLAMQFAQAEIKKKIN